VVLNGAGRADTRGWSTVPGVCGSSTVLDAVLFVLLVGAAVGVFSGAVPDDPDGGNRTAAETADVLAGGTATVSYTYQYNVLHESLLRDDERREVRIQRTARGSYAELLAAAAVATPSVAGTTLATGGGDLEREVSAVTAKVLPTRDANIQVRVTWRPYSGGPPGGQFSVGDRPPADADRSVATMAVPSGFPNVTREAVESARSEGYAGVARTVARGVVVGLFPPDETRAALYSDGPELGAVAARYADASDALGVETDSLLERRDVRTANDLLAAALAERVRSDLSSRFESPVAAARSVRIDQVRITVGTWSA